MQVYAVNDATAFVDDAGAGYVDRYAESQYTMQMLGWAESKA